jgi:hypothetical protein
MKCTQCNKLIIPETNSCGTGYAVDDKNNKICALLRRFSRSPKQLAYYSESTDDGHTWSKVVDSPYYNANNSILCVNRHAPLVIWNNDPGGRENISLGTFSLTKPQLIAKIDGYGSYPAACVDKDTLHVVYTGTPNPLKTPGVKMTIKYKQYNLEAVVRAGRKDRSWQGFSQIRSQQSSPSSPWRVVPPKNSPSPGPQ